jgi:glutamate-5-semialdehyde dehydrogenase
MAAVLHITARNNVLASMAERIAGYKEALLQANSEDLKQYSGQDIAIRDRLKLDDAKIEGMITSIRELERQDDPLDRELYRFAHPNGMEVCNRTSAFGTVLIIYESRPDVTIEAAGIAFKSGNRILLKGGKEALNSNLFLTGLWHEALNAHDIDSSWVRYLALNRLETRDLLSNPAHKIDLIVPRGGEKLIALVKQHAQCPVIVSGRGNNFLYIDGDSDPGMAREIIINAKTTKISACNALDKVLIDHGLSGNKDFMKTLVDDLQGHGITVFAEKDLARLYGCREIPNDAMWSEEFLDYKILLGVVQGMDEAILKINSYSGGHSATIVSNNETRAMAFMEQVDTAAVYHNASTRFTDGGQFGLGGELAISTDKLHQRGPLGLQHLTTNKCYVKGNGQIRT